MSAAPALLAMHEMETWMQAAAASTQDLATAIGLSKVVVLQSSSVGTTAPSGAFISLVGPKVAVQVGFQTTAAGCMELSKALLGMDESDLTPDIVRDATCEIGNMLAGLVKRRMGSVDPGMRLGLPMFIEGRIHPGPGALASYSYFELGRIPLNVVVYQGS
jgi:hypothetical protein